MPPSIAQGSTLALATSRSSNHTRLHCGNPLICVFLLVVEITFDRGRLQNNHVITAATLLALAALPPVLAEAAAAALLAMPALSPVLAEAAAATLLAGAAPPPVLAHAFAAALLAGVALPPVLAEAAAAAVLAPAAPPPVFAEAAAAALLAGATPPPVRTGHLGSDARFWQLSVRGE